MKDSELLKEFIRVEKTAHGVQLLVCMIAWDGPHTPVSTWLVVKNLPGGASEAETQLAATDALEDPRYFSRCVECSERKPVGWMHDDDTCQGCAERNHGVVH